MTETYFAAFQAGEKAAIERMIDFYGGAGTFASWPQRVRDYAVEATPVNILDWASAYGFALTPALLGAVEIPALVLWGEASHPAVRRANELLGRSHAERLDACNPRRGSFHDRDPRRRGGERGRPACGQRGEGRAHCVRRGSSGLLAAYSNTL